MEKIFALILDIMICSFAVLFMIISLVSFKNYHLDASLISEYQDNWSRGPILDIFISPNQESCPQGFENLITNSFPGMNEGCDCTKSTNNQFHDKVFTTKCSADHLVSSCKMIFPFDKVALKKWKGTMLCASRMKQKFWELVVADSNNCPSGYKGCGILDNFNNTLCVPNVDKCPVNDVMVLPSYKNPTKGYQTLKLQNGYNMHYTNSLNNSAVIVDIEARQTPPCTHPYEGELGQNTYPLNTKIGPNKCTTLISDSFIDYRFEELDSQKLSKFYYENEITKKIFNIPGYSQPNDDDLAYLYKINYFGWDKKCLIKIKTKENLDSLAPKQDDINYYANLNMWVFIVSVINLLFVIGCIIIYKCFIENLRVSFTVVKIIDGINLFLINIMIIISIILHSNTSKILQPFDVFISNKCGDKLTSAVMSLAFDDISKVNGLLITFLIFLFIEALYLTAFHIFTYKSK